MKKNALRSLVILGSCAVPALANAQADAEAAPIALEEVIVTAQKKAESLQDTPISLTSFSEDQLDTKGISSLADMGSEVPSLTIEPFPINNATLRIFIRGIGISDTQVTQDPPVGIYVDGVYVARATGTALDVADLQRIEVLRGPQGTLYGRNTTGGAINLVTRRPSAEAFEFKQKFTVANRGKFTTKTMANIPLADTMAVKLAYMYTENEGFVENTGVGANYGDKEVQGFRVDYRWDISDRTSLDFAYDNSEFDFVNTPYQSITLANANSEKGQADPIKQTAASESIASKDRLEALASGVPMEWSSNEIEGYALILTHDFDSFQVKYIGAYRELTDQSYADLTGGAGSTAYRLDSHQYCGPAAQQAATEGFGTVDANGCSPLVVPKISQEQTSHEFQLTGDLFDSRVEYIAGLYLFEETAVEDNTPFHHQLSSPIDSDPSGSTRIVNMLSQKYDVENEAAAIFGQFTWTPAILEDRLHLTFGARHSEDTRYAKKFQQDQTWAETPFGTFNTAAIPPFLAGGLGFQLSGDRTFDNIEVERDFADDSFGFVAEFDLTDDINVYGKMVEAYKSGGFNTRDPHRDAAHEAVEAPNISGYTAFGVGFVDGFDEEKVLSYELGLKSELLDRRLRLNANVFTSEFTNMQLNFLVSGTVADTKVVNAGEGEMSGFEADLTYLASRNLLFVLNYAFLDTEVTKATAPDGSDVADSFVFFSAPEMSYTLSMDWTIREADWGRIALNASTSFMDERNGGANADRVMTGGDPDRGTHLPDYQLFNARLGVYDLAFMGGMLSVSGWVKNITDEEYYVTAVENLPHHDKGVLWGDPRSYGLDLIFDY